MGEWAALFQNRFQLVQRGEIVAFPEEADGDYLTPHIGLLHGQTEVGWIVAHLFQLLGALLEELVAVVVVICHARTKGVNESEAFVLDTALDELDQVFYLTGESSSHIGGPCGNGQRDRIDRIFHASVGCAFGLHPFGAGGGDLAGGQPVDLVVHDDVGKVDVSAHAVDEVVSPDAEAITVATGSYNLQFVVGELGARSDRQRSTV